MSVYIKGFLIACQGIPTTVWVSLIAIVIGAAFGLLLALCSQTRSKILQVLAKIYVDVVRGTPMLVQALIMAYGVPWLLQSWGTGFKWANLVIPAIIVCGCNSAAYMSEIIRSGIQAVDKGQMEAARSLGMSHGMAMKLIIIPQAIRQRVRNSHQGDFRARICRCYRDTAQRTALECLVLRDLPGIYRSGACVYAAHYPAVKDHKRL